MAIEAKRRIPTVKQEIDLGEDKDLSSIYGRLDSTLKLIEEALGIKASMRGNKVFLHGDEKSVGKAERFIREFYDMNSSGYIISPEDVKFALRALEDVDTKEVSDGNGEEQVEAEKAQKTSSSSFKEFFQNNIPLSSKKKLIVPRSEAQRQYIAAIKDFDMVIGIGPAGTGKTYLAMAMAINALLSKQVSRIILARPAVEAGEKLGFLPGDLYEKVNPYLRPLYDALFDMMEAERAYSLIDKGIIEIAPLAFMRGRTLNDSFIILDEAQNTTSEQMKMYLTRLGFNSKTIITGDITQIDLPSGKVSGLVEAAKILSEIKGVHIVYFSEKDVVRHRLVQEIIKAYDRFEKSRNSKS